jgi:hypothetical protein
MSSVFAIFASDNPQKLKEVIRTLYPDDSLELGTGEWLVASDDTAQSVSIKLTGIVPGEKKASLVGSVLVASISAYWGIKSPTVWDWIKAKWGQPSG